MIDEQIKSEIAKQINDKFKTLEKSLEIFSIPLTSQYRVLVFRGLADGTSLIYGGGTFEDIQGRTLVIKAVKLIPYYSADGIDINFSDGTTETVYNNTRIERIFDFFTTTNNIKISINGNVLTMFQHNHLTVDLFCDNIFYKYPEKINSMDVQVNMRVVQSLVTGAAAIPQIIVLVECYLI